MRTEASTSSSGDGGLWNWHGPVPYVFLGIAGLVLLIAVALIILWCSSLKPSPRRQAPGDPPVVVPEDAGRPSVVVFMPGDDHAAYLAVPVPTLVHDG
ncbi:Protein GLUTAMINE DUMPER 2 [Acorus gramineus]|uniref:Protein GLUTAMINE DUMPER 2 n=1 Tax=Acorus gramineus TaxID=55184 RepID=A0AAV9AX71_ACOGR|nr:Protein GLUTAMINE DUMPER 2 [Acorus gramineus]